MRIMQVLERVVESYGIFGAYAALVYYTRRTMPQLKQIIMPIIVIAVIMTFLQPNVNFPLILVD